MLENYIESIETKLKYAECHYNQVSDYENNRNDNWFLFCSAEFVAMMQSLHTCFDILAQWVSKKYHLGLSEDRVYFSKVKSILEEMDLKEKIEQLDNDGAYLNAFVNYTKHRNIIRIKSFHTLTLMGIFPEIIVIDNFNYNGQNYDGINLFSCLKQTYETITADLNDILDFCRENTSPTD